MARPQKAISFWSKATNRKSFQKRLINLIREGTLYLTNGPKHSWVLNEPKLSPVISTSNEDAMLKPNALALLFPKSTLTLTFSCIKERKVWNQALAAAIEYKVSEQKLDYHLWYMWAHVCFRSLTCFTYEMRNASIRSASALTRCTASTCSRSCQIDLPSAISSPSPQSSTWSACQPKSSNWYYFKSN